jgi:ribosomal protein S20
MKIKKSELREMIKEVLKEELSARKNLKEAAFDNAVNNIDESAIDDCLARIEANSGSRSEDWATVRLSKKT